MQFISNWLRKHIHEKLVEVYKRQDELNPEHLNKMFTMKKCQYVFCETFSLEIFKSITTKYSLYKLWGILANKYNHLYH